MTAPVSPIVSVAEISSGSVKFAKISSIAVNVEGAAVQVIAFSILISIVHNRVVSEIVAKSVDKGVGKLIE